VSLAIIIVDTEGVLVSMYGVGRSADSRRAHTLEKKIAAHVSNWQLSDRLQLGVDNRPTSGNGRARGVN
jgi:hypothetical protein